MRRALLLAVVLVTAARAQDAAEREDLQRWKTFVPLSVPADEGKLAAAIVPPAVFGGAHPRLEDLRLVDARGRPIPYALRTLEARQVRREVEDAKPFDRVTLPDGSERLALDLGERAPEHNEVAVTIGSPCYGRPVLIEASEDRKTWNKLLDDAEAVHLRVAGQTIDRRRFSYPPSRLRYVRVTLRPDRIKVPDAPMLRSAVVSFSVEQPGKLSSGRARLQSREPVRARGDAGSAWVLDLGDDNVPVSRLTLTVAEEQFQRPFILEVHEPGSMPRPLTEGMLRRKPGDPPLAIHFREVQTRWLKLTIIDSRNPPLSLHGVEYAAAARQLVFRVPAGGGELRAYVGNPEAMAPNYDFAAALPGTLGDLPAGDFGARQASPDYVPPPVRVPPWTERHAWLLDGVFVVSLLVLAGLLTQLARAGIRRADAGQADEASRPAS